jgi:hypothetical protein
MRPGAYPRVDSPGQAPALRTNIRLGWKDLPGPNALAHYENSKLTDVKGFITLATGCKHIPIA